MLHFDYDKDKTVSVSEVMKGIRDSLIAWGDSSRSSSPKLGLQTKTDDDSGLGPLPPWITKVKASSGRYYYKNHNTKNYQLDRSTFRCCSRWWIECCA